MIKVGLFGYLTTKLLTIDKIAILVNNFSMNSGYFKLKLKFLLIWLHACTIFATFVGQIKTASPLWSPADGTGVPSLHGQAVCKQLTNKNKDNEREQLSSTPGDQSARTTGTTTAVSTTWLPTAALSATRIRPSAPRGASGQTADGICRSVQDLLHRQVLLLHRPSATQRVLVVYAGCIYHPDHPLGGDTTIPIEDHD